MIQTTSYHDTDIVPLSERRSPVTMGLVWITMVTGLPTVLVGFEWYKSAITLSQAIICAGLSCLILLLYTIPANQLGAHSGQTFGMLSRNAFGRFGSYLVSANIIWIFLAFYGLNALFVADSLHGLYHLTISTTWVAAVFAMLMACNNFFGFTGVANFAKYVAAPVLIVWIGYAFFKAAANVPPAVFSEVPHQSFFSALSIVSTFVIGFAVWGNEPDYWRYGKPKQRYSAIPVALALLVGQIVFPITGWLLGRISGITETAAATNFINQYSLGGVPLLAAVVIVATMVAMNDSNLYGMIITAQNIRALNHQIATVTFALLGTAAAVCFSSCGLGKALEWVATVNCVILPTATVIMLLDWFLLQYVFGRPPNFSCIADFASLPAVRWPALISLIVGWIVGIATSGVVVGLDGLHVGVCSMQAWLTAMILYVPLRVLEDKHFRSPKALLRRSLPEISPKEMADCRLND